MGTVGALLLIGVIGIYIWTQQTYTAVEEIDQYTEQATEEGDWLVFEPGQPSQDKGFILYPGARVEPEAYSYLASMLTEQGYTVVIPSVRFNLAIADSNKADEMISASPINSWYIGGHSLGGVAAAMYASESTEQLSGLFFLASYPSIDLSESSLPVLSIYGENDGLTSEDDINESVNLLPEETDFFLKYEAAITLSSACMVLNQEITTLPLKQMNNSNGLLNHCLNGLIVSKKGHLF